MTHSFRPAERRLLLAAGDTAAVIVAVPLALWTWSITAGFPFDLAFLRARAVWWLAVPLWLLMLVPTRDPAGALDLRTSASAIVRAAAVLLFIYLAAFFSLGGERLPRLVALYALWDTTLLVFGWRLVAQWSFAQSAFARRVAIAGSGRALAAAWELLQGPAFRDAAVLGALTDDATSAGAPWERLGPLDAVDAVAREHGLTDLVVALDDVPADAWVERLLRCQERGTHVVRMTELYESVLRRVPVQHLEPSWLLSSFFDVAPFRERSPLAKRAIDIGVGLLIGAVALVLTPFITLAVVFDSRGPVFYSQTRLGRGGRAFLITKFRTMQRDAEADGAQWASAADPRITRVGRVLRRTRLDELPNVLAILRGDMSVIGPRPERPEFVDELAAKVPFYRARLVVAPGLTGWAQVNYRYGDSVDDATVKLEYDLYYIKHQSSWLDAVIFWRTLSTVLRFEGR